MIGEYATRISGRAELDESRVCYWRAGRDWLIYLPRCGVGRISDHVIQEHQDNTISVTPSIVMTGHDNGEPTQRHGFLTKGVWYEC
jgi:hypothetical protein